MYTILIVDDAKDSILLLEYDLTNAGFNVLSAENGEMALKIIEKEHIDLVLLDLYMPVMSGLETLKNIKSTLSTEKLPVIMLSSSENEDEIVTALELDAADYVTKPYLQKVLLARINTALRLAEKTAVLEEMAQKDFLTGINNRRNFYSLANKAIKLNQRNADNLVIGMCDIDHFKQVNDQYGHDVGDEVLINITKIMTNAFRDSDILGRIGGEEFAFCLPCTSIDDALIACERLRVDVAEGEIKVTDKKSSIRVTISLGLTSYESEELTLVELLNQADQALYEAKNNGRNKVKIYNCSASKSINDSDSVIETSNIKGSTDDDHYYPGINVSTGIDNVLGDEDLFEQILVMFYQDHALDEQKLFEAINRKDMDAVMHLAHTLKGVASSIGAMDLFKQAKELDDALNCNQTENCLQMITNIGEKLTEVIEGIKTQLSDKIE